MSFVTYNNIIILSPWKIISLEDVNLSIRPNEHSELYFKGIILEEEVNKIERDLDDETIQLNIIEDNIDKTLFCGNIFDIKIHNDGDVYSIEVKASSATRKMDLKKNNQSFQNISLTYEELIKIVIKKNSGSTSICSVGEKEKIGLPIIQYQETDWEFIKRLASHFNTVVVPETSFNSPRFWFGLPDGKNCELSNYKNMDRHE